MDDFMGVKLEIGDQVIVCVDGLDRLEMKQVLNFVKSHYYVNEILAVVHSPWTKDREWHLRSRNVYKINK